MLPRLRLPLRTRSRWARGTSSLYNDLKEGYCIAIYKIYKPNILLRRQEADRPEVHHTGACEQTFVIITTTVISYHYLSIINSMIITPEDKKQMGPRYIELFQSTQAPFATPLYT